MIQKVYQRIPLTVLFWIVEFDSFTLTDELFTKGLQRLKTCISFNSKLFGKLVSLTQIIFDDNRQVMSVAFLLQISIFLNSKFDNFSFTL